MITRSVYTFKKKDIFELSFLKIFNKGKAGFQTTAI